jgi:hypothetical protein
MLDERFSKFESKMEAMISRRDDAYQKLWEETADQKGRIASLERFRQKYEPKIDNMGGQVKVMWFVGSGAFTVIAIVLGKLILG